MSEEAGGKRIRQAFLALTSQKCVFSANGEEALVSSPRKEEEEEEPISKTDFA